MESALTTSESMGETFRTATVSSAYQDAIDTASATDDVKLGGQLLQVRRCSCRRQPSRAASQAVVRCQLTCGRLSAAGGEAD